jgi:hypothetical protein
MEGRSIMPKARTLALLLIAPFLWASAAGVAAAADRATGADTTQYTTLHAVTTSAPVSTTLEWNTTAHADFGFGFTQYHADTIVPARVQLAERSVRYTFYLVGVVYTKVEGPLESPDSFTILDGTFTTQGVSPIPDDPTWGHGLGTWNFTIATDNGTEYHCTGMILDFNRTEDRDVQNYVGPVIEP